MCWRKWIPLMIVTSVVLLFSLFLTWAIPKGLPNDNYKCGKFVEVIDGNLLSFNESCAGQLQSYRGSGDYKVDLTCKTDGVDAE